MALEQTLCHPCLREPTNGELELAINPLLVACLLGDPAEPHMGFADAPGVSQLLRQVQRLLGKLARGRRVALLEAELAQAEQDVSAPRLVVGLIAELQRAVQVLARLRPIALSHQDQAELILGTGESDSFSQQLQQRHRPERISRRGLDLTLQAVRKADLVVQPCQPAQV